MQTDAMRLLNNALRKTTSVCPVCLKDVSAAIIEEDNRIYLEKYCDIHGRKKVGLSAHPRDYKTLHEWYFYYFSSESFFQKEYYLCITSNCNIACPICFLPYCSPEADLSIDDIIARIKEIRNVKRFTFSHGEATVVPNLLDVIFALKKTKKVISIHTNGIKLAHYEYLRSLKNAGISHVSLQFDGFSDNAYRALRGASLLRVKLQALENLEKISIPTTLNVTIARKLNENEVGNVFDYAVKNSHIKDISYISYSQYDSSDSRLDYYIMPDELISFIEAHTRNAISRDKMITFQKIYYTYCYLFKKRKCFNYYHYIVVRTKNGFCGIDQYLNIEKIATMLECYKKQKKKISLFIFVLIICRSLRARSILLLFSGLRHFVKEGYPRKRGMFLVLTFASICDPYKYDKKIAAYCGQGIITKDMSHESYGTFIIEKMKEKLEKHENSFCK